MKPGVVGHCSFGENKSLFFIKIELIIVGYYFFF
jgi:hypothetical protein